MKIHKSEATRSPLKRKPLRNPGESIQLEMENLLENEVLPQVMAAVMVVAFAVYEWIRWLTNTPPQPIPITIFALIFAGYTTYKVITVRKRYRNLRLGLEGEKAVGQYLERLRVQGCSIFHDIIGDNFNIDHVIVSTKGVFVIETKTYSKPVGGEAIVTFDGEEMLVNGFKPDRNPVIQVRALSNWLREMLHESTNRKYSVKGVVLLPGWFVNMQLKNTRDVWVLNPRALPNFIENEPDILAPEDVALISSRITNYMQNTDR
jgi:hypothetical protein